MTILERGQVMEDSERRDQVERGLVSGVDPPPEVLFQEVSLFEALAAQAGLFLCDFEELSAAIDPEEAGFRDDRLLGELGESTVTASEV